MKRNEVIIPEVYEVSNEMKLEKQSAVMENTLLEARYSLTVEEQRLVLATIAMLDTVETAPNGFPTLRIPKKLIIEATGVHEKNYHQIKTALRRLMQRIIEIETIEKDGRKRFRLYQWFAKADYKEGDSFIEVQFHPDLKPYLLELKMRFTKIPLIYVLKMRSKYAIRLYELLKRYEDTGLRNDYLPELRKKLGIKDKEYKSFRDFERRVLARAVKEINQKTDIEVSYKKKRTGRKITHIEFTIMAKPEAKVNDENLSVLDRFKVLNKCHTPEMTKRPSESLDTQGLYNGSDFTDRNVGKIRGQDETNEIDGEVLNRYHTPEMIKRPSESLDTQGLCNGSDFTDRNVGKIRGQDETNEIDGEVLNRYHTPEMIKRPSESLDTQGLCNGSNFSDRNVGKVNQKNLWERVGNYRKEYREILTQIKSELKRLSENQVLFLLINADKIVFTPQILKEIILNADKNKELRNPMGYLVKVLNIDMNKAEFKELTLTARKIDEELLKAKLKELLIGGKSAKRYMQIFWNSLKKGKNLTKEEKKALKEALFLLREPLKSSVYDDFENKIYIPVPDEIYKEWFETNWIDKIKEFVKDKFDIDDIELLVLNDDEA